MKLNAPLKAFTLIELLIVVAIIAILAAIAVPNFLEAQTRAKVSRVKADQRTLATGLEAYYVDNNQYPKGNQNNTGTRLATDPQTPQYWVLERLSTPVAFLTSALLVDAFPAKTRSGTINPTSGVGTGPTPLTDAELVQESYFKYAALTQPGTGQVLALNSNTATSARSAWFVWSAGPTRNKAQVAGTGLLSTMPVPTDEAVLSWIYDPTNGTVSQGNVFRVGGPSPGRGNPGGVFVENILRSQN